MEVLLVLILIALIVIIVLVLRGQRRRVGETRPQRAAAPTVPADPFADLGATAGDPRAIRAGDMVEYLGRKYFVRGSLRLTEGGYGWSEHFLDDVASTKRWLSVEEDPDLEVVLWTELDGDGLRPDGRAVVVNGAEYRRIEHGTARYRSEGTTGLGDAGQVEYVDYETTDAKATDRYLSFERFGGGEWEAGLGELVPTGALTVYPGSGN